MTRAKPAAAAGEVVKRVRARARTEGLEAAYDTALAVCRDEKARAAERLDGANLICRIGGVFEGAADDEAEAPLSSMSRAELARRAEQARALLAALDAPVADDEAPGDGVFD
ncbi:hypothetical protein AFCDBAGC_4690 [Methylobacterium cerastii]|uniref:Terminase small subunit n=1 Tax=Methylobacterium cerastii TaxID=932741 RepID=A0ABQ4QQ12_9HYPH|nr:hypothetical protein [Methylobacterium cerastii]GJD46806.1 hypothetical protein AFCDBAGC_4690 [Methylobacterium cerastii]